MARATSPIPLYAISCGIQKLGVILGRGFKNFEKSSTG